MYMYFFLISIFVIPSIYMANFKLNVTTLGIIKIDNYYKCCKQKIALGFCENCV